MLLQNEKLKLRVQRDYPASLSSFVGRTRAGDRARHVRPTVDLRGQRHRDCVAPSYGGASVVVQNDYVFLAIIFHFLPPYEESWEIMWLTKQ